MCVCVIGLLTVLSTTGMFAFVPCIYLNLVPMLLLLMLSWASPTPPSPLLPPAAFAGTLKSSRLVLDLSCRRRPGGAERGDFLVVTNKWQKFTHFAVTRENLGRLAEYCDEFLVHGVDAEVGG